MKPQTLLTCLWKNFGSAPHRMMFLGGVIQLLFATTWWFYDLIARYTGWFPFQPPLVSPPAVHAYFMIYGFMPFFMFGFLFTAGPRWLNTPAPARNRYIPVFLFMMTGSIIMDLGVVVSMTLLITGAILYVCGWISGLMVTFRFMYHNIQADRRHLLPIALSLGFGLSGALSWLLWLKTGNPDLFDYSRIAGIWLFLLPVFMTVSHRMIPFFSRSVSGPEETVWRPFQLLWLILTGLFLHALLEWYRLPALLWPDDLVLAVTGLYMTWRWNFFRSFQVRLLAMLHIGFAWFGLGMLLFTFQDLVWLVRPEQALVFGWAPLHALTMGFFLSTLFAMVTRVSLGHGGRPLMASRLVWQLFILYQAAVLIRIMADIIPDSPTGDFYCVSAAIALLCFIGWSILLIPLYFQHLDNG